MNLKVFVGSPPRSERGELACHAKGVTARRLFRIGSDGLWQAEALHELLEKNTRRF